jgi:hypothetical protein
MKKSWLKYLWLLGFLGLLGLVTSNKGFYGFFGFFGFFGLGLMASDERLEANINKSARNAFISSIVFFVASLIFSVLTSDRSVFMYAFIVNFALIMIVFVVSLRVYDRIIR